MVKIILEDGSLDPASDFEDDGGTPDFRARQTYRPGKRMKLGKLIGVFVGWFLAALMVPPSLYIFLLWFSYTFDASAWAGLIVYIGLMAIGLWFFKYRRR